MLVVHRKLDVDLMASGTCSCSCSISISSADNHRSSRETRRNCTDYTGVSRNFRGLITSFHHKNRPTVSSSCSCSCSCSCVLHRISRSEGMFRSGFRNCVSSYPNHSVLSCSCSCSCSCTWQGLVCVSFHHRPSQQWGADDSV